MGEPFLCSALQVNMIRDTIFCKNQCLFNNAIETGEHYGRNENNGRLFC